MPAGLMDDKERFECELEFLQCFANPQYLSWLAQSGMLDDRRMINYLDYLKYWQRAEYARFVTYPMSLFCLDLLQQELFRRNLRDTNFIDLVDQHLYDAWLNPGSIAQPALATTAAPAPAATQDAAVSDSNGRVSYIVSGT